MQRQIYELYFILSNKSGIIFHGAKKSLKDLKDDKGFENSWCVTFELRLRASRAPIVLRQSYPKKLHKMLTLDNQQVNLSLYSLNRIFATLKGKFCSP